LEHGLCRGREHLEFSPEGIHLVLGLLERLSQGCVPFPSPMKRM
jgi:hypothetical protein